MVVRENPQMWQDAKNARGVLPLGADENAMRPIP
jgi:hypothetical protein